MFLKKNTFACIFKRFSAFTALAVLCGTAYSAWIICSARAHTLSVVLPSVRAAHYALLPSDLTPRQLEILLKVEDPDFFHHSGVDFSTPGAGITTITQGLVKHLYFEKFEPGFAKLKQTLIAAFVLDPLMSKNEQLTLFINTVYLGHKTRGFEQASQFYFRKPFKSLTEDQYIALVAMIIAPAVFDAETHPDRNLERAVRIRRLVSGEYVPRGLFDMYYGPLDAETQKNLPPLSYFAYYYK